MNDTDKGLDNKPGLYTGGGITLEKMISPNFGLGSGIQYRYFNTEFRMKDEEPSDEIKWTFQSINIPFLMILSLGGENSSLNLEGGFVYSRIYSSVMKTSPDNSPEMEDDVLTLINTNQLGLTAGIIFKIKATKYTDFVFGVMGEYYPTNLLYNRDDDDDEINMYNYSLTTGYMLRTNIFPGSEKK